MKYSAVQDAVAEARRFIRLAEVVKKISYQEKLYDGIAAGKDSGALRRASLDLTRALAEMRKP